MVRWLESTGLGDIEAVGGKAARLGAMRSAGLPVPEGFVLEVAFYEGFVDAFPDLREALGRAAEEPPRGDALAGVLGGLDWPPGMAEAIAGAYRALELRTGMPDLPVAVRSSAPGEDGERRSFAGQHATYLNACGIGEVLACVRACWGALWSDRAIAYRGLEDINPAIAVIIQALVWPTAAGVAFTANPMDGDRSCLLVDVAWGLGEAVVGGSTDPDHLRIDKATGRELTYRVGDKATEYVRAAQGVAPRPVDPARRKLRALPPEGVERLRVACIAAEQHFGGPQDVEFAWQTTPDGGRLFMLQSRPITALPPATPANGWRPPDPDQTWERRNFAEHVPGPLSPLAATLILPAVGDAIVDLARALGLALDAPAFVTINGYAYARGTMRRRPSFAWRAPLLYAGLFLRPPSRWQRGGLQAHERRMAALAAKAAPADNAGLVAWCEASVAAFATAWRDLHRLSGGWRWTEIAVDAALGAGAPHRAARLIGPLESPGLGLERRLATLAREAPPAVRAALLADDPDGALTALGVTAAEFRVALVRVAAIAADLPATFDPVEPLPYGTPSAVCRLVAAQVGAPGPEARRQVLDEVTQHARRESAAQVAAWRWALARLLLPTARRFAAAREPALGTLAVGWPELRARILMLGARLAAEGRLSTDEDVFWCEWGEVRAMAAGAAGPLPIELEERRALHATQATYSPPLSVGGVPERTMLGRAIAGVPASPGRARGRVRVLHDPALAHDFMPGDILVAPGTSPAWTPLFHRAAAIVTDVGGPLSHGSIVAREFGIPAVLGTGSATRRLVDGQIVTVDGDQGVVWL